METVQFARRLRTEALKMVHRANASHIGGALSSADILAVLYERILDFRPDHPDWPGRDRFIMSKGHACSALYAALAIKGYFPEEELEQFGVDGSRLLTHVSHKVPGVELSTGSLGHGLPVACGKALAAKKRNEAWRTYVLLSDGEMDEGSNWEAVLFAPHHRLDNLVAIIDYNKIQSLGHVADVLDLDPLAEKLEAFRWAVRKINGHDHGQIHDALVSVPWVPGKPSCVVADTIKGKGVGFMEDELAWHYRSPNEEQLVDALAQIRGEEEHA